MLKSWGSRHLFRLCDATYVYVNAGLEPADFLRIVSAHVLLFSGVSPQIIKVRLIWSLTIPDELEGFSSYGNAMPWVTPHLTNRFFHFIFSFTPGPERHQT